MLIKIGKSREDLNGARIVDPLEQYDSIISDQAEKAKLDKTPLSARALRELAESYRLHGVGRVDVKITDTTYEVFFRRHDKRQRAEFGRTKLPFEAQARAILSSLAAAVRC
jgi:hypothetical protein